MTFWPESKSGFNERNHMIDVHDILVGAAPIWTDENTTFGEVLDKLNAAMREAFDDGESNEERFGRSWDIKRDAKWWGTRRGWLLVYWVEGASEGHYVHIDTMNGYHLATDQGQTGTVRRLMQVKTFNGAKRAKEIADLAHFLLTDGEGR